MTRYGSRAPEIIAMRFITDAVASAHKAASRKDAFLRCCNSLARSREPLACLRPRAFALPITSMAKYLSSIRLVSVLLASTPSSGGCSSGSNNRLGERNKCFSTQEANCLGLLLGCCGLQSRANFSQLSIYQWPTRGFWKDPGVRWKQTFANT